MLFGNAVRGISCVEIGSTFSRGFKSLKKQVANYSTNFFFGLSPRPPSLSLAVALLHRHATAALAYTQVIIHTDTE